MGRGKNKSADKTALAACGAATRGGSVDGVSAALDIRDDRFAAVLGSDRGSRLTRGGRADDYDMPASPDGHPELTAVDMRPHDGSVWWTVGWYGSDLTISIDLDRPGQQSLWCRHYKSGAANTSRPLSHDDPYPHLRLSWAAIPYEVKTRILAEVALGMHPLTGTSNDWPLNPF